jgi:hypothetical protein
MKTYFLSIALVIISLLGTSCNSTQIESSAVKISKNAKVQPEIAKINGLPAQINPGRSIRFDSAEKLTEIADLVIIAQPSNNLQESGKVSKKNTERSKDKVGLDTSVVIRDEDGKITNYYTLSSVKVKKVLKGNIDSKMKVIGVLQSGALVSEGQEQYVMATEGFTPLDKGSKYLLFLKEIDGSLFPELSGMYSVISVNQGKFNLDKSDKQEESSEAKDPQYRALKEKVKNKHQQDFDSVQ